MPKVEAAAHRNRHRLIPIPKPRFETLRGDDQHNYEFDRYYQSLRVAWSLGQIFISSRETKQLHSFLKRIYEPTERPTTQYRPTKRRRPHRTEANWTQPQPADVTTETLKKKEVEFQEYNGWQNYPSWSVFTVMTSDYDTYQIYNLLQIEGHPLQSKTL